LGRRRNAAVLAASLATHIALLAAWLSTRPPAVIAEPPATQIELIHPPPREAPKPRTPSPPGAETPLHLHILAGPAPAEVAGPPLPPAIPAPKPIDPRKMTDQELLAGSKPDLAKIYADEARQPLTRNGVPTDGCKPTWEHSDRVAPPCPIRRADDQASRALAEKLRARPDLVAESQAQEALRSYRDGNGEYPGLRCAFRHTHCGVEPPPPPGLEPARLRP
jgi:hypothetical protein